MASTVILPTEMFGEISSHITDGLTWKSWIFTCRTFAAMNDDKKVNRYANHLLTLIIMLRNNDWDWYDISKNPNITIKDVLNYPEKPWNWNALSSNPNITLADLLKHPYLQWNWWHLTVHPNITVTDILAHPELPWIDEAVISNDNLTLLM